MIFKLDSDNSLAQPSTFYLAAAERQLIASLPACGARAVKRVTATGSGTQLAARLSGTVLTPSHGPGGGQLRLHAVARPGHGVSGCPSNLGAMNL